MYCRKCQRSSCWQSKTFAAKGCMFSFTYPCLISSILLISKWRCHVISNVRKSLEPSHSAVMCVFSTESHTRASVILSHTGAEPATLWFHLVGGPITLFHLWQASRGNSSPLKDPEVSVQGLCGSCNWCISDLFQWGTNLISGPT